MGLLSGVDVLTMGLISTQDTEKHDTWALTLTQQSPQTSWENSDELDSLRSLKGPCDLQHERQELNGWH